MIKVDERTVDIRLKGVNPTAIWELGDIVVARSITTVKVSRKEN